MSGFAYAVDGASIQPVDLHDAVNRTAELVWIHLTTTNEEAESYLCGAAGLPDYIVEPLLAAETRPRCDQIGDGAYLNLRGRSSDDMPMSDPLASVRVWAVAARVISVTRRPMTAVAVVEARVREGHIHDPGDLIAELASAITEELDPEVAELGDTLDDCEEQLDPGRVFELRRQVTAVRVQAIAYRRFLSPQRTAIEKLGSLPVAWLHVDDRMHLAAAADRAARMAEELESIRERAALTHEALTDLRAEQIDARALIISIVAMIFLPLTFLTGLLGMNVKGIPYADQPWAFDGVVAVCAAIAVAITGYFIQRHWFR
ncbi:CorA family divalent cation transporter [Sphingomonas sp.]|uniref:CorA family divalent cation transporter n=1 Tax=Sphingomonas sp. TaxID=28214 RepID=UPI001DC977A9|nr:CorA family divalent cation transporter [Sphingomonas sp.]MBX9795341.1 zinc transporter ZntB [Sphingomonas sp.]